MRRHIPQRPGGPDQEENATSAGCAGGIHRAQKRVPHPSLSREFLWAGRGRGVLASVASEHLDGRTVSLHREISQFSWPMDDLPDPGGGGRVEAAGDAAAHPAEAWRPRSGRKCHVCRLRRWNPPGPKKGSSSQFVPGVSWGGRGRAVRAFSCVRAPRWENLSLHREISQFSWPMDDLPDPGGRGAR
jgi:hypothetical protein